MINNNNNKNGNKRRRSRSNSSPYRFDTPITTDSSDDEYTHKPYYINNYNNGGVKPSLSNARIINHPGFNKSLLKEPVGQYLRPDYEPPEHPGFSWLGYRTLNRAFTTKLLQHARSHHNHKGNK